MIHFLYPDINMYYSDFSQMQSWTWKWSVFMYYFREEDCALITAQKVPKAWVKVVPNVRGWCLVSFLSYITNLKDTLILQFLRPLKWNTLILLIICPRLIIGTKKANFSKYSHFLVTPWKFHIRGIILIQVTNFQLT